MEYPFFTSEKFPNTHIYFDKKGVWLVITLNIPEKAKKYLAKNNIYKGSKHWVYSIKKNIKNPTQKNMHVAYNELMVKAMTNTRLAKINNINEEIIKINS